MSKTGFLLTALMLVVFAVLFAAGGYAAFDLECNIENVCIGALMIGMSWVCSGLSWIAIERACE